MQKKCIFHVPNYIDPKGLSGSQVRPLKMIKAFENIGYEVDVIMGYSEDRKKQIKNIKNKIKSGIKYEFLYSESSTMPTLLTDRNHFPTHPFLDFGFFKFCKTNGIPIGLFYRDMHWKYDDYKSKVIFYKRFVSNIFYKYDLFKYNKLLDILYLPSNRMRGIVQKYFENIIKILPPGSTFNEYIIDKRENYFKTRNNESLNLFYVGGIEGIYDLTCLLKTIRNKNYINLILCCRESEWSLNKNKYSEYLTDRVKIVHESGENLKEYYLNSDICCCYFESSEYMKMAMPIKLLEYLSYVTPVLSNIDTCAGDFVKNNGIGWFVKCEEKELSELLDNIYNNQEDIKVKHLKCIEILKENTWEKRALQVKLDIGGIIRKEV